MVLKYWRWAESEGRIIIIFNVTSNVTLFRELFSPHLDKFKLIDRCQSALGQNIKTCLFIYRYINSRATRWIFESHDGYQFINISNLTMSDKVIEVGTYLRTYYYKMFIKLKKKIIKNILHTVGNLIQNTYYSIGTYGGWNEVPNQDIMFTEVSSC